MRSSNPVLREDLFSAQRDGGSGIMGQLASKAASTSMSLMGTIIKSGILLFICVVAAIVSGSIAGSAEPVIRPTYLWLGGGIVGLVLSLIISFVPKSAPFLAPIHAIAQGALLGGISVMYSDRLGPQFSGMIVQAVFLTFGIFAGLLTAFSFGFIRIGGMFRKCLVAAIVGIGLTYLGNILMSAFGINVLNSTIFANGWIGIGFSLVVIVVASLTLVLDFQFIEEGIESNAPKYMEWYAGFALLVTLVWLYLEILRLLSKLRRG